MRRRKRLRKKLHRIHLYDVRYEISLSNEWRDRLFASTGSLEIGARHIRNQRLRRAIRRYDLHYLVQTRPPQAGPSNSASLIELHFTAREFPREQRVSWNNAAARLSAQE
jgi:hypothetical protein